MLQSPHYCLWPIPRGDGRNYAAHEAFSLHLKRALEQLGHDAPIVRRLSEIHGRPLVIGPHRILEHPTFFVPKEAILINTEHLLDPLQPWQRRYVDILRQFEVWDFSHRNIAILNRMGICGAKFLELGACSGGELRASRTKDIEVLFYGAMNPRRRAILAQLGETGVKVTCLHNVFGEPLHEAISRAVIVLNIHRIDSCSFEVLRMLDLLPYGQFVVSEKGADSLLEDRFNGGVVFSPLKDLAEVCHAYLSNPIECGRIGQHGRTVFELVDQAEVLKNLLSTQVP